MPLPFFKPTLYPQTTVIQTGDYVKWSMMMLIERERKRWMKPYKERTDKTCLDIWDKYFPIYPISDSLS